MLRRTVSRPVLLLVGLYTLANGAIHLQDWLDGYRNIPSAVPGSWVVRLGFPLNSATALALAGLLLFVGLRQRFTVPALLAAIGFNVSTLALLIATRTGSVFGWSEPVWTPGADQVRAAAIGAIAVGAIGFIGVRLPRRRLALAIT